MVIYNLVTSITTRLCSTDSAQQYHGTVIAWFLNWSITDVYDNLAVQPEARQTCVTDVNTVKLTN